MYADLKQQVLPRLITPGARVLIAVSGGPDSVALAHILWRYALDLEGQISLVITHVHHGVRPESDQEELMVRKIAEKWQISCRIHRFDAKAYAKQAGKSFQEAAREWRYARWQEDMRAENCSDLATAHHLGDQAETVLYRLLRGSGTTGLAGIYPRRAEVIRPLLTVSKQDILAYCAQEQLPFALDSSNEEAVYIRNKIRLKLLPELANHYNTRVQEALGRTAELLQWDEQYLSEMATRAWKKHFLQGASNSVGLQLEALQEPSALLSRLIRRAAAEVSGEQRGISFHFVKQIMDSGGRVGWKQDLPGLKVMIDYRGIWFRSNNSNRNEAVVQDGVRMNPSTPVKIGEWTEQKTGDGETLWLGFFPENADAAQLVCEFTGKSVRWTQVVLSRDLFQNNDCPPYWRYRLPGDRLRISGLGHKDLKKVFQEMKIGREERERVLLLALGREILWIPELHKADVATVPAGERILGLAVLVSDPKVSDFRRY